MKYLLLALLVFGFSAKGYSAESCVQLDVSGWSENEKKALWGKAYSMAYRVTGGNNVKPTYTATDGTVCFDDALIDVGNVVKQSNLDQQRQLDDAQEALSPDKEAKRLKGEVATDYANWDNLNAQQKDALFKKAVRFVILKG